MISILMALPPCRLAVVLRGAVLKSSFLQRSLDRSPKVFVVVKHLDFNVLSFVRCGGRLLDWLASRGAPPNHEGVHLVAVLCCMLFRALFLIGRACG